MTAEATGSGEQAPLQRDVVGLQQFQQAVDKAVPSKNIFYAVKVQAVFDYVRVRTVPRQHKPYPPLVEVAKNQPEYTYEEGCASRGSLGEIAQRSMAPAGLGGASATP